MREGAQLSGDEQIKRGTFGDEQGLGESLALRAALEGEVVVNYRDEVRSLRQKILAERRFIN